MEDNNLRMQQKKEHSKRIKRLGLLTTATAFIFIASTYAWFIGTQEVKINDFEVKIAATESLKLSLTGGDWADELTFGSRESLLSQVYATTTANEGEKDLSDTESPRNTNVVWPKYDGDLVGENASARKGLVPISTIGEMDKDTGKMKIFEKASFTPTPGGYRLIASQINNYTLVEGGPNTLTDYANQTQKGYVAFDLFVKNISGSYYNTELNGKDEEAIYLTTDSAVFGQDQAGNVYTTENDATKGIENSVRVAFAQIGRVHGDLGSDASTKDADLAVIQSITCINSTGNPTKNFVTGICGQKDTNVGAGVIRNAIIWEPNDKVHNTIALDYFKESCKQRVKFDSITNPGSQNAYTDVKCNFIGADNNVDNGKFVNGNYIETYSIKQEIKSSDMIDVYDGLNWNGTGSTVGTDKPKTYLEKAKTFTDTHKVKPGNTRPTFMTLAPNSITKIRVYIYLEGQDIDNFDRASDLQGIKVNFGFTKQRYTEDEMSTNNG